MSLRRAGFAEEAVPHLDAVYRFALRLAGGDVDLAEDIVQDTFLRAYRSWSSFTPGTNCRSWLFTICRNVFLRDVERSRRWVDTPADPQGVGPDTVPATAAAHAGTVPDPERQYFDSIVDAEVLRAIDSLPEEFREIVILRELHDLSYAEIAEVVDVPVGTVRSRLARGRGRLQQALREYAVEMGYIRPSAG